MAPPSFWIQLSENSFMPSICTNKPKLTHFPACTNSPTYVYVAAGVALEWHLSVRNGTVAALRLPNPVTSEAACHLSRSTRHFVPNPASWFWPPDSVVCGQQEQQPEFPSHSIPFEPSIPMWAPRANHSLHTYACATLTSWRSWRDDGGGNRGGGAYRKLCQFGCSSPPASLLGLWDNDRSRRRTL